MTSTELDAQLAALKDLASRAGGIRREVLLSPIGSSDYIEDIEGEAALILITALSHCEMAEAQFKLAAKVLERESKDG